MVPKTGIDWKFLRKFRELIISEIKKGKSFYIIVGGGTTARNYIEAADKALSINDEDRDWLGIHSTRLNAHLLRTIFREVAHPKIIKDPMETFKTNKKIIIGSGWKPGWSTDYVAAMIAEKYKVKTIINLSNIDYVYDSDPKKNVNALKFEKIQWKNFRKIVGSKWKPGMNAPFDPIASKKGEALGLEVIIMNGKNLDILKKYFSKGKIIGTKIS